MDPSALRTRNIIRVLRAIMNKDGISRTEIALETNLTKTTVSDIVRKFVSIGFLEEQKAKPEGVGRPSLVLRINPQFAHVVGLNIMRDGVNISVIDSSRRFLWAFSRSFHDRSNFNSVMKVVFNTLDEAFEMARAEGITIKAVGIGTPGLVDPESGFVILSPKFDGFENVPLVEMISKRYGVDAWLENDSDMAAIGEKWFGKGRECDSFIYVYVVEGIGAGIVLNGKLIHGEMGHTGEIGHLLVKRGSEVTYLEELFGLDVLLQQARALGIPAENLVQLGNVARNDRTARKLVEMFAKEIGLGVHAMVNLFGTANVFIGGKAPELGEVFLKALEKSVLENLFYKHSMRIEFSELGASAVSLGAAAHGLEMYLRKVLT